MQLGCFLLWYHFGKKTGFYPITGCGKKLHFLLFLLLTDRWGTRSWIAMACAAAATLFATFLAGPAVCCPAPQPLFCRELLVAVAAERWLRLVPAPRWGSSGETGPRLAAPLWPGLASPARPHQSGQWTPAWGAARHPATAVHLYSVYSSVYSSPPHYRRAAHSAGHCRHIRASPSRPPGRPSPPPPGRPAPLQPGSPGPAPRPALFLCLAGC